MASQNATNEPIVELAQADFVSEELEPAQLPQTNPSCSGPRRAVSSLPTRIAPSLRKLWKKGGRVGLPTRLLLAMIGAGLGALLAAAVVLEPAARGYGTHEALGLPPCTFVMLFDRRCPSCGMTTSWARLLRGNVVGSLGANPGGTLLCLLAMVGSVWTLGSAARGCWLLAVPTDHAWIATCCIVALVTIVHWLIVAW